MDLPDRRVERIRVLAYSTDMGVPLPCVHPAFEALRRVANLFGSQAEARRGWQESACFATFRFMFFPFSVDPANQLHEFLHFGARLLPSRIGIHPVRDHPALAVVQPLRPGQPFTNFGHIAVAGHMDYGHAGLVCIEDDTGPAPFEPRQIVDGLHCFNTRKRRLQPGPDSFHR